MANLRLLFHLHPTVTNDSMFKLAVIFTDLLIMKIIKISENGMEWKRIKPLTCCECISDTLIEMESIFNLTSLANLTLHE